MRGNKPFPLVLLYTQNTIIESVFLKFHALAEQCISFKFYKQANAARAKSDFLQSLYT